MNDEQPPIPCDEETSLERILDRLVESYASDEIINDLQTHALPNRRAVVDAFHHIQHLLFLGFFSTRQLDKKTLRLALAEHLLPAQEILEEQIRRACAWEDRIRPAHERLGEGYRALVCEVLHALPELRQALYQDIQATYQHDPAATSIEEVIFCYPSVIAITAHRLAHVLERRGVPMIPRILSEYAHERTGIDIHPGATIGARFFIDHGTGVVVGATTVIGDDVKLYQGVTLGALSLNGDMIHDADTHTPMQRHPTLEDRVTVYAGATILGGETTIGAGSVIGGNVWLIRSVPPNSKVYHRPNMPVLKDNGEH